MNTTPTSRVALSIVAILVAVGAAAPALAQQYRPGGTALDRNLQTGSGGINPRGGDIRDQIWLNNRIITGSAPAGRSFRGYVGYSAPNEFRGVAGSDDLYSFRRDSASGYQVQSGVGASDALRYQLGITTGQSVPRYLAQTIYTPRESSVATGAPFVPSTTSALRSTADFLTSRALRPTLVGARYDREGNEWNATASPLLGLAWARVGVNEPAPVNADTPEAGASGSLPTLPSASPSLPGASPDQQPARPQSSLDRLRLMPTGLEAQTIAMRLRAERDGLNAVDRTVSLATAGADRVPRTVIHNQLIDVLRETYKPAPEQVAGAPDQPEARSLVDRELDRVSRVLRNLPPLPPKPVAVNTDEANPFEAPATPAKTETPAEINRRREEEAKKPIPAELIEALRASGVKDIESFIPPAADAPRDADAYRQHMQLAQSLLAEGRFFDAEDRFTRAMAAMPTDPMARIGRVHAQLGAGLFLSASTNLRGVLRDHPELVGARFDAKLIPSARRVDEVAGMLRAELAKGGSEIGNSTGLLLAYLGHLTGDPEMTNQGLAALRERVRADDGPENRFIELLEGVWKNPPNK